MSDIGSTIPLYLRMAHQLRLFTWRRLQWEQTADAIPTPIMSPHFHVDVSMICLEGTGLAPPGVCSTSTINANRGVGSTYCRQAVTLRSAIVGSTARALTHDEAREACHAHPGLGKPDHRSV